MSRSGDFSSSSSSKSSLSSSTSESESPLITTVKEGKQRSHATDRQPSKSKSWRNAIHVHLPNQQESAPVLHQQNQKSGRRIDQGHPGHDPGHQCQARENIPRARGITNVIIRRRWESLDPSSKWHELQREKHLNSSPSTSTAPNPMSTFTVLHNDQKGETKCCFLGLI